MNLIVVKVSPAGDHRRLGVHDASPKEFHSATSLAEYISSKLRLFEGDRALF